MGRSTHAGRQARLQVDFTDLQNLAERSRMHDPASGETTQFIQIEPVDVQPGWAPEKYLITFACRGISAIDDNGEPIASEHHQVQLYMTREYPGKEPALLWLTPIWHPNIAREEPRHVCTNDVQTYHAQKPIDELVLSLAEMVQYKVYHAKWEPPYPLDTVVARWVREVAEPRGWLGPHKPFDPRPLLREYKMKRVSVVKTPPARRTPARRTTPAVAPAADVVSPSTPGRMRFGDRKPAPSPPTSPTPTPQPKAAPRIAFGGRRPPTGNDQP